MAQFLLQLIQSIGIEILNTTNQQYAHVVDNTNNIVLQQKHALFTLDFVRDYLGKPVRVVLSE